MKKGHEQRPYPGKKSAFLGTITGLLLHSSYISSCLIDSNSCFTRQRPLKYFDRNIYHQSIKFDRKLHLCFHEHYEIGLEKFLIKPTILCKKNMHFCVTLEFHMSINTQLVLIILELNVYLHNTLSPKLRLIWKTTTSTIH